MVNTELIKSLRSGLNLTQYQFAKLIGLDTKTIKTMENGKSVTLSSLKKLADQFNMPLTAFVTDD